MESKKNPKVDLNRKSSLFFLIGLCIALGVSWASIEYRQYERGLSSLGDLGIDLEEEEDVEILEIIEKPPPPPPPPPKVVNIIKIVDDDDKVEELDIQTTDVDEDEAIEVVDIVDVDETEDNKEYNFKVVEDKPIYPGCENVPKSQREACFEKNIRRDISKSLSRKLDSERAGTGGRTFVQFTISKTGEITKVRAARAPNAYLEKLSIEIVSSLPKIIPAKQRGKAVQVRYTVPITVNIE